MAQVQTQRPLSPHLQIYRWYLAMALSTLHRITGCGLACGLVLLTWWLVAVASGPDYYAFVQGIVNSWIGGLVLLGFTFSVFYHLANGVRHLAWDVGFGFELPNARLSGYAVVVFAGGMTVLLWLFILIV